MSRALRTSLAFAALAVLATSEWPSHAAGSENDAIRRFLFSTFKATDGELDRVDRGQIVTRTLPANDPREIGTLGMVRLRISPDEYVARVKDIVHFKKDEAVLQIGVFSTPATADDLKGLTLDDADVRSLRSCRVGDCSVQLSAPAIGRVRGVDWRRSDAPQAANGVMREILVDYVAQYQKIGAMAAMQYDDRPEPIDLKREFKSLAESELGGCQPLSPLRQHLFEYPARTVPDIVDVVYWSKEKVGRRTVASVTHLAISKTQKDSPTDYAIATRQIYGTHYFDSSLGLTILMRDRTTPAATYLAYVNRSRIDIFGGMLGGVFRKIITSKARTTVAEQLTGLQRRFDASAKP